MSRGRYASRPSRIPLKGLLDVATRVFSRIGSDNIGLIAAGIGFYGLLSIFPAITSAVALGGYFVDPQVLVDTSDTLAAMLPEEGREIIMGQLRAVVGANSDTLGLTALLALALAIYSASRAVENLMSGLNVVYQEKEKRGFVLRKALVLVMTLGLVIGFLFTVAIIAAIPAAIAFIGFDRWLEELAFVLRWPLLLVVAVGGISFFYRYAPDRRAAKWRWLTPGATVACLLWVSGSYGFSVYAQTFASYNETFGALGGVIILLTWMWLSAFMVLLGALIDAELEAQTRIDTTVDGSRPMGARGARAADMVGTARGAEDHPAWREKPSTPAE
ncbi:YihY/virulence factor BrkB family protein [Pseudaestuariivita sp.]|uniref:YihY/virulence factor BrkB family protein n=1 Tax=Pseudaestuariivita sp. TaxID=2211669 RepID=UPI00405A2AB9